MEKPSDLCSTPSGTRLRYLRQAVVCSILTFPLNPPLTKGDLSGFSSYNIQQKNPMENHRIFAVPPQGLEPWTLALRVLCSTN